MTYRQKVQIDRDTATYSQCRNPGFGMQSHVRRTSTHFEPGFLNRFYRTSIDSET
jgi:hypothetical protein